MKLSILTLGFLIFCSLFSFSNENQADFTTAVFQAGGLNQEGLHPTFFTHSSTNEIAKALSQVYGENQGASETRPKEIQILVPDTMSDENAEAYKASIEIEFKNAGMIDLPLNLLKIPVLKTISESELILNQISKELNSLDNNSTASIADKKMINTFYLSLKNKSNDLKIWAKRMTHWREWKQIGQSQWHNQTPQEKDKVILTIFGAVRGIPGIAVYANDAGINPINIARMVIAYAADIFFTVAPQKLAALPKNLHLPELKTKTQQILSWGISLGLLSTGYGGTELSPTSIQFQIENASPFIKNWFDNNIELKSFLFNYSLNLGIPLSFLSLGYYAKGGEGSGALNPFDISFLLEFAGLQLVDGAMGMFAGRGARVLGEKSYLSGRSENIVYTIFNVIGQIQGLGVATGNTMIYKYCLLTKNALQGLTFLVSRILPEKSPNLFIFHSSIQERDRKSILYTNGIIEPTQIYSLDGLLDTMSRETPGPSSYNRWLGNIRKLYSKSYWNQLIPDSLKFFLDEHTTSFVANKKPVPKWFDLNKPIFNSFIRCDQIFE